MGGEKAINGGQGGLFDKGRILGDHRHREPRIAREFHIEGRHEWQVAWGAGVFTAKTVS